MKILYFYVTNGFDGFLSFNIHIDAVIRNSKKIKNFELVGFRPIPKKSSDQKIKQAGYLSFYSKFKNFTPRWLKDILAIAANIPDYKFALKRIEEERPDAIFFRYNFMNFYQLLIQKKTGLPLILEVNSPLTQERIGDKTIVLSKVSMFLEHLAWKKADKIQVVSEALKKILSKVVDEEKIFVAHNGVDVERFENISKKKKDEIRIGFVGSFGLYHGIDMLFKLIPKIVDKYDNVTFYLIGQGGLYPKYKEYFSANEKYKKRVVLTGYISHDEIPNYLTNFDISILPDFTEYGSPLKLFEYMMAKTAVVLPSRATIKEIINDGIDGICFEPRNQKDFENSVIKLLEDKELRVQVATNAFEKVKREFKWVDNVEKIKLQFQELLEQ